MAARGKVAGRRGHAELAHDPLRVRGRDEIDERVMLKKIRGFLTKTA